MATAKRPSNLNDGEAIAAAACLLDRGYGKPVAPIDRIRSQTEMAAGWDSEVGSG